MKDRLIPHAYEHSGINENQGREVILSYNEDDAQVEDSFNIHNSKPLYGPEMIAVLAHRLWTHWSQHIAKEESISQERLERWESLWVEFEALSSDMREKDDELVKRFLKEKPDYDLDL